MNACFFLFFFSSRRRHTRLQGDWSSDVCSSDLDVPLLHHATLEPMNCTAHVRAGECDVWAPTQNQGDAQRVAAEVSGLPKEKVRIHTTPSGGGFGCRLEPDFVSEAVRVSQAAGVPVKVVWTREDDMRNGFYRPTSYNRFSAGLDASGRLVAWTHRIAGTPLRLKFGPLAKGIDDSLVDGAIDLPYAIPNVLVDQLTLTLPRCRWTRTARCTFLGWCAPWIAGRR